ncbi:MAG: histone deacetylase [Chloroflexota bacterium]|nr:MAG: histone deacetylase [Chloroflexota bacterium]
MAVTAYITHPRCAEHTLAGHVEHAGRIQAIWRELDNAGLRARMHALDAVPADLDLLHTVHDPAYIQELRRITQSIDRLVLLNPDTYAGPASFDIALLAAGGAAGAVDEVLAGRAANALAVVRPPGHHATAARPMGFCLLANVALAVQHARRAFGLERVLIVDYDVHHGNGTQDAFYDDPGVLFISTHQHPFYPGTGAFEDTGAGAGRGFTVNLPLPAGHGDASYAALCDAIIWPLAQRFQPQLVAVSAGFDAHWADPLGGMALSLAGYARLTRELIAMADSLCAGKIIFVLEGGYNLDALAHGVRNIAHLLLGDSAISDPLGSAAAPAPPDITAVIAYARRVHGLG